MNNCKLRSVLSCTLLLTDCSDAQQGRTLSMLQSDQALYKGAGIARLRTSVTGPFQSIIFWRKTAARREAECRSLACPVAILCMPLSEITPGACFGPWSAQRPPT